MNKDDFGYTEKFISVQTSFAEYISYFGEMLIEEQNKPHDQRNQDKIVALSQYKSELLKDFNAMTPNRPDLIQKIQYVYSPILEMIYKEQGIL